MCVMWSTADQFSEFENVHKQIKISKSLVTTHCALSQSTRVRMLKYTCKTAQITDSGISYLMSKQSRFFFCFVVTIREFPYYFDFTLSQTGRKYCDAWSISLNMASQVWLRSILIPLSYYAKLYLYIHYHLFDTYSTCIYNSPGLSV